MSNENHLQDNLVIALKSATSRTLDECRAALVAVDWDIERAKEYLFENRGSSGSIKTLLKG